MISVQNLRRLSSGNKIVFFVCFLMLASCGGSKKAVDRSRTRSKSTSTTKSTSRETTVKKKDKVKVIEWEEGTDTRKPPITESKSKDPMSASIDKEDVYDITFFIPFDAVSFTSRQNTSDRFVQYYAGLLVASEILEKEDINLRVNVVDEKKRKFENVLTSEVNYQTDVIVGPYDRNDLRIAAKYANENEIPLISPWQASSKIAKDNPYYVQLRPNLDEHYYSIFEDIKKKHGDEENLFIIGSKTSVNDSRRVRKLQQMAKDVFGDRDEERFEEFLAIPDSIDLGMTAFDSIFVQDETNIVVIPNWSFDDEDFIYGALRRMSVEKGTAKLIVYGMPIMMESEKINFDYYNALNMRVARSKFVDERDADVQRFRRDFLYKYGALPTDDAYEGYDNLMYIGRNLSAYGKQFQYFLHKDQGYYLQARYRVEPATKEDGNDRFDEINYFENKNVDIIEFKDNTFVRNMD